MTNLKFYKTERALYPKEFNEILLTQYETLIITRKLSRHFKFKQPIPIFKYNTDHRLAKLSIWCMNLGKTPSLGMLIHELAHFYNYEKQISYHHNKKLLKTIKLFMNYCIKKNYWKSDQT